MFVVPSYSLFLLKSSAWLVELWWILDSGPRSPHSRLAIAVAETGACETGRAGLGGRGP